jgi:hypothetical protein
MHIPASQWLDPWIPVSSGGALERELAMELPARHILKGIPLRAIARRLDNDDVLFELADHEKPLAVVHLSYKRETDPQLPWTVLFDSWEDWVENCMEPDHEEVFGSAE